MSETPLRVLHVVGRMDRGGIETLLMELYRRIDREKVQFDFLAHYGREAAYNDEIRSLGGRIYEMPMLKDDKRVYYERIFAYRKALHRFFAEHPEVRVLHGHMTNTASIYMPIARAHGVQLRIAHSHNTHSKAGLSGIVTDVLQMPLYRCATDYFACSEAAQHWFYPDSLVASGRIRIFANAVDIARFRYDAEQRCRIRRELGIRDERMLLCTARFRPEKNQAFLLDVLAYLRRTGENALLVLAGDGECEAAVREKARANGLEPFTRFLGVRSDIPALLSAADAFVLPSLWEGLPLAVIEAQANGLSSVVSDAISGELNVAGLVEYVSLRENVSHWGEAIRRAFMRPRADIGDAMRAAGYDIAEAARLLENFYLERVAELAATG